MKLVLGLLLLATAARPANAQSYSIDWHTIGGGGGTSTGGVYGVSGTIGQPDAGTMSGGSFSVTGGFWSLVAAVRTPGAPYLWLTRTPTNTVCVWWPVPENTWQLQATANLTPGSTVWTVYPYTTNGPNCVRVEPPPTANRFYRLYKP